MVNTAVAVGFVLYLVAVIGIGIYGNRLTETVSDYLLAGRGLNVVTASLSEQASLWSGWLTVGFPALVYSSGVSALWWMVWQIPLGLVTWGLLAKRIARYSRILKSLTIPDFLTVRHDDPSHLIRVISTTVIGVFMVVYVAGQVLAGASAIAGGFGLSQQIGFVLTVGIVIVYTIVGGFWAVSLTDVLQAIMMTIFAIVVPIGALVALGGPTPFMNQVNDAASAGMLSFTGGRTPYEFLIFSTVIAVSLGGLGQPHGISRYMGMKRPSQVGFAMVIAIVFMLIALIGVPLISLGGIVMVPNLENPDLIAPTMILETLPPWFAGLLLAGIVAAVMSTADSQLLVAASAIGEDIYKGMINPDAGDAQVLWVNRLAVLVIGSLAATWAWLTPGSVHTTIVFAWAGLGAGIGPALISSVYWKETTGAGVIAGMVVGLVSTVVWHFTSGGPFMIFEIYELLPAFGFALLAIYLVSRVTGPPNRPDEEIERELEDITKPLQEEIDFARERRTSTETKSLRMTEEDVIATYIGKTGLDELPRPSDQPSG